MVDMSVPHQSPYLRADDLPAWLRCPVVITWAGLEQVGQDQELAPVISVARVEDNVAYPKKMVLNKTNNTLCFKAFGKDGGAWVGQKITIWHDPTVMYKNDMTGGLKVAIGHDVAAHSGQVAPGGAIPLPGPAAQPQPAPGNGQAVADPVATGAAMNMAGHTVPLPTGMPTAPPNPAKPFWAGPGSDLDEKIQL